jgi:hypothetical protein
MNFGVKKMKQPCLPSVSQAGLIFCFFWIKPKENDGFLGTKNLSKNNDYLKYLLTQNDIQS